MIVIVAAQLFRITEWAMKRNCHWGENIQSGIVRFNNTSILPNLAAKLLSRRVHVTKKNYQTSPTEISLRKFTFSANYHFYYTCNEILQELLTEFKNPHSFHFGAHSFVAYLWMFRFFLPLIFSWVGKLHQPWYANHLGFFIGPLFPGRWCGRPVFEVFGATSIQAPCMPPTARQSGATL